MVAKSMPTFSPTPPAEMPHIDRPQIGWLWQLDELNGADLAASTLQRIGIGAADAALRALTGDTGVDVDNLYRSYMPPAPTGGFWMRLAVATSNIAGLSDVKLASVRATVGEVYARTFEEPNFRSAFGTPLSIVESCQRALRIVPADHPRNRLWVPPNTEPQA